MALFAGETARIETDAIDFDAATALTDADVDEVVVEIADMGEDPPVLVVAETAMTWEADESKWIYLWNTGGSGATPVAVGPGTYRAKCTVRSAGDTISWEYKTVRLKANPTEAVLP